MSHGFLMAVAERLGIAESIDFICTNTMTLASVETDTYDLVCYACKACQYGPFTAHICPAEVTRNKKK